LKFWSQALLSGPECKLLNENSSSHFAARHTILTLKLKYFKTDPTHRPYKQASDWIIELIF
jgi:hypothetical protein